MFAIQPVDPLFVAAQQIQGEIIDQQNTLITYLFIHAIGLLVVTTFFDTPSTIKYVYTIALLYFELPVLKKIIDLVIIRETLRARAHGD